MFDLKLVDVYIQKQIENQLNEFRFENGRRFPKSYKEFAGKYGYGLALGLFCIYIPMKNYCDSIFVRSNAIKNTYKGVVYKEEACWFELGDIKLEQLKHMYPFAKSENGDYLFWNTESGTTDEEMDIYLTNFRDGFVFIGKNLDEFFDKATNPNLFNSFPLKFDKPLPPTFKPYTVYFD